ncbi:hypothetical protein CC1G_14032 [Coprinopsis cinerea okayama7|uniref:Uncharacterized protein n=1 Tax=Coprinopsis cinerea (strain Okayama-7 / 130 / ATCC MYA-4618 / FGSC 9003) TaxID=240176 RepID=D6RKU6_COPC7|nr:hypothetical protein CC1G_14032 [Coprinopsis cinerea okayama7\|eukprot:XP_002911994.1 hypothetical protein CC1G_14032 [Coprinopsis cinerea okayama7\
MSVKGITKMPSLEFHPMVPRTPKTPARSVFTFEGQTCVTPMSAAFDHDIPPRPGAPTPLAAMFGGSVYDAAGQSTPLGFPSKFPSVKREEDDPELIFAARSKNKSVTQPSRLVAALGLRARQFESNSENSDSDDDLFFDASGSGNDSLFGELELDDEAWSSDGVYGSDYENELEEDDEKDYVSGHYSENEGELSTVLEDAEEEDSEGLKDDPELAPDASLETVKEDCIGGVSEPSKEKADERTAQDTEYESPHERIHTPDSILDGVVLKSLPRD